MDVVRTRVMATRSAPPPMINSTGTGLSFPTSIIAVPSSNPYTVFTRILREEGGGALVKGWLPRAARAIGSGVIQVRMYVDRLYVYVYV